MLFWFSWKGLSNMTFPLCMWTVGAAAAAALALFLVDKKAETWERTQIYSIGLLCHDNPLLSSFILILILLLKFTTHWPGDHWFILFVEHSLSAAPHTWCKLFGSISKNRALFGYFVENWKNDFKFFVLARTVANFQFSAIFTAKKTDHLCLQFSQQIAAQLLY